MTNDSTPILYAGNPDENGDQDGGLLDARFESQGPLALGPNDDLFLIDKGSNTLRKITETDVSTLYRLSSSGVSLPGVATDSSGNVYILTNGRGILKITPTGSITTFAKTSTFTTPMGIAIDSSDTIYVTDLHRVLKFTLGGNMTVVAGSKSDGFVDAVGEAARFSTPGGLAFGSDDDLYVTDTYNDCIRKVSLSTGEVTLYAGVAQQTGTADGPAASAMFQFPITIAAASDNVFYVADYFGKFLRKIYTV
ncbi:hypothetical protein PF008_g25457 [Phytophthora fragariae]|uniref:SMP-30/Gluconolactonase/LRE-like region domain-containing protein n=1 Tax=Phytophthora fragariae TaxID=53985 RepID=A0A6G0QJX1_9STRA|nr:hypothetical protein PF008_g25457 [Phytophthora fragariae]